VTPTIEQQAAVEAVKAGGPVKVKALAGVFEIRTDLYTMFRDAGV